MTRQATSEGFHLTGILPLQVPSAAGTDGLWFHHREHMLYFAADYCYIITI